MKIKLSELEAKRKAMTPGPWRKFDDPADLDRGIDSESGDTVLFAEPIGECNPRLIASDADLIGIVATHNAADALIRVVKAALAWRTVRQQNAHDALVMSDDEVESSRVERLGRSLDVGRALDEALAEVEL